MFHEKLLVYIVAVENVFPLEDPQTPKRGFSNLLNIPGLSTLI